MKKLILLMIPILLLPSAARGDDRPTMAVLAFDSSSAGRWGEELPDLLTDRLVNTNRFRVVERHRFAAVMVEQGLQTSGFVQPDAAIRMGRITGARYLLTGRVLDASSERKTFRGYGSRVESVIYRLKAAVRVLDTATGELVFSHTAQAEETDQLSGPITKTDTGFPARLAEKVASGIMRPLLSHPTFKAGKKEKPAEKVAITITSQPEKADVEIDGVFVGNAGATFQVTPGLHRILVSLPGYEPWNKQVRCTDGLSFHARLAESKDARIEIDVRD